MSDEKKRLPRPAGQPIMAVLQVQKKGLPWKPEEKPKEPTKAS